METPIFDRFTDSRQRPSRDILNSKNFLGAKYVVIMVGLPARGKSYISKKLARYLSWSGFNVKIFNVGNRRRLLNDTTSHTNEFFNPLNIEASKLREKVALEALEDSIGFLKSDGKLAILDATNTTFSRREAVRDRILLEHHNNIKCFFIESICFDQEILSLNMNMKLNGPDYINQNPRQALQDFKQRVLNYEKVYETIGEKEESMGYSFIKIIDVGSKIIANRIKGYLPSQCVFYLMQMHIVKRTIWLSCNGETEFTKDGRIGGDPGLSDKGLEYSSRLFDFIDKNITHQLSNGMESSTASLKPSTRVLCSTLKRSIQTCREFENNGYQVTSAKILNEIYAGDFEGLTELEVNETGLKPTTSKINYRYPGVGGESIQDVIERLRPFIIELERLRINMVVITHKVVLKTLLAYFTGLANLDDIPSINLQPNTIYKLEPTPYGADLIRYKYNEESKEFEKIGVGLEMYPHSTY